MRVIQNNTKLLAFISIISLIATGFYYFTSILSPQLETLQQLQLQQTTKQNQLQLLEAELSTLPEKEQLLTDLEMEISALRSQIPSYEALITIVMEMAQYMTIYQFQDAKIDTAQPIEQKTDIGTYYTMPINISFIATYTDAIDWIEELHRSYKMITIHSLTMNNSIQEQKEEKKEKNIMISDDSVEVEISLSIAYMNQGVNNEKYINFMEFNNQENSVFQRQIKNKTETQTVSSNQVDRNQNTNSSNERAEATFALYIADPLSSGDNYRFSSYIPNQDPLYAGLASAKDTTIIFTLNNDGYSCVIQDIDGQVRENKANVPIHHPVMMLTSQIQKVMEVMPKVDIYIFNDTKDILQINARGTGLDTIFIYNEKGERIQPGEQKGNIVLKR